MVDKLIEKIGKDINEQTVIKGGKWNRRNALSRMRDAERKLKEQEQKIKKIKEQEQKIKEQEQKIKRAFDYIERADEFLTNEIEELNDNDTYNNTFLEAKDTLKEAIS